MHRADLIEQRRQILEPLGDDVDDLAFALQDAVYRDHRRGEDDAALALEDALPDDRIGDSGLVLQREEGDIALARPLPDQDDAGDKNPGAVLQRSEASGGDDAAPIELRPQEGERMGPQRQLDGAIIL